MAAGFSYRFSRLGGRNGAGADQWIAAALDSADRRQDLGYCGALACDGVLGRVAPARACAPQHHAVRGAGLRVSFPMPPNRCVRGNLQDFGTLVAIPSASRWRGSEIGATSASLHWSAKPSIDDSRRQQRSCVSTANRRWQCWGSVSHFNSAPAVMHSQPLQKLETPKRSARRSAWPRRRRK